MFRIPSIMVIILLKGIYSDKEEDGTIIINLLM
jgi:hypothetical protein